MTGGLINHTSDVCLLIFRWTEFAYLEIINPIIIRYV